MSARDSRPDYTRLACHVLELVRATGLHTGQTRVLKPDGCQVWHLDARSNAGETWFAEDADFYRAAVLLAELVGIELEE